MFSSIASVLAYASGYDHLFFHGLLGKQIGKNAVYRVFPNFSTSTGRTLSVALHSTTKDTADTTDEVMLHVRVCTGESVRRAARKDRSYRDISGLDGNRPPTYHFVSCRNDDLLAGDDGPANSPGRGCYVRDLLAVMKALADENRLRIVAALDGRELCLCQIVELIGLATSTVSRHASILQQARLVRSRKQGRWTYFRLDEDGPMVVKQATASVLHALEDAPQIRNDRKRLTRILKTDPEELCRKQNECKC